MSLVGSLQDLGLGDILQIVSLSRKSGLLLLRSDAGEGRIVLREGQVRAAFVKGEPDDLRGLLVGGDFVAEADFDAAVNASRLRGLPLEEALAETGAVLPERLESLRREHVERAVLAMFRWRVGEFSFEVRAEIDERDAELLLPSGISAQFLTMEATRLGDERRGDPEHAVAAADAARDEGPVFSGEPAASAAPPEVAGACGEAGTLDPRDALALATAAGADDAGAGGLVVIDPDLGALEWIKSVSNGLFERVHIFQRTESGIARIRQYLARAEPPTVLVSASAPGDPLTGVNDLGDFITRLRSQAPHMPLLVLRERECDVPPSADAADAVLDRPPSHALADRRRWPALDAEAERLRQNLRPWASPRRAAGNGNRPPGPDLERLRQLSRALQDPARRGEVMSLVLAFAAEQFPRVALFLVRDDVAVGIAQAGMAESGGPDDEALRDIRVPLAESAWFEQAVRSRAALRAPAAGEADRALVRRLGGDPAGPAYVAPIVGNDRVVALLVADGGSGETPPGETAALEIVLHEAGLALDRAVLERALEAAREADPGAA